ncbi:MAG: dTDP-4-dehydrorhamnose 3,5-epimerase [Oligoflexia bacterium]|nr:dTDP-4-dehydrorhamnose 3,5-epimerase [Oligoflexia bacterium]
MHQTHPQIEGLKLIEVKKFSDNRGFFSERYNSKLFSELGLKQNFVQDNLSYSKPGVLRGMHIQYDPPQGKLIGVISGSILDVVVDLRPNSQTYLKNYSVELSGDNARLLWIPPGFAHGFCILGKEPAYVYYKVDALYNSKGEVGLVWNDPDLNITWPIKQPILSPRDATLISYKEYKKKYEDKS